MLEKKEINRVEKFSFWHEFWMAAKETPALYFRPITLTIKYLSKKLNRKNKPD